MKTSTEQLPLELALPPIVRPLLSEALALEILNETDARLVSTANGLKLLTRLGMKSVSKEIFNHRTALVNIALQHPLSSILAGTVAAIYGIKAAREYKDYSTDPDQVLLALGYLLCAPASAAASLNMQIAGNLVATLERRIVPALKGRLEALLQLLDTEGLEDSSKDRIRIYRGATLEAEDLFEIIKAVLAKREQERKERIAANAKIISSSEEEIARSRASIELKFKAGLLTREEHLKLSGGLMAEKVAAKIAKISNDVNSNIKTNSLDGDEFDLRHFHDEICVSVPAQETVSDIFVTSDPPNRHVWIAPLVTVLFIVFLVYIIFDRGR